MCRTGKSGIIRRYVTFVTGAARGQGRSQARGGGRGHHRDRRLRQFRERVDATFTGTFITMRTQAAVLWEAGTDWKIAEINTDIKTC